MQAMSLIASIVLFSLISFLKTPGAVGAEAAPDSVHAMSISTAREGRDADTDGVPGSDWGALQQRSGTSLESPDDEEKKERVPKKKNDPEESQEESVVVDEDEGWVAACFGGIIGSFFASLCNSDPEPAPARVEPGQDHEEADPEPTPDEPPPQPASVDRSNEPIPSHDIATPTEEKQVVPADVSLMLDVMWGSLVGPSDVADEYSDGGGHIGLSGYYIPSGSFEVGVDARYSYMKGVPIVDYVTPTMLDSPQESHIYMFDTGLRAGMIHTLSPKGTFLRWGLGPRLFWVKEKAYLEVYSLPSMGRMNDRIEQLEKWRFGGDLLVSLLWNTGHDFNVGLSTRLYLIPWESAFEKSLTLDYIGNKTLVGLNVGLAIHFNGF
jgi:hypothetical protein